MKIALCGTARSGKTSLFEILTGAEATTRVGGGRPESHLGVSRIPDPRLERLSVRFRPKKTTPASVQFQDLLPLVEGSRSDTALVAELRAADALLLVVRAWDDPSDPHPAGSVDPVRDVDLLLTEFLLADLEVAARRVERLTSMVAKTGRQDEKDEIERLRPVQAALEEGTPVRRLDLPDQDEKLLRGFGFLTAKPLLVAVNLDEADTGRIGAGPEAFGLAELASGPGMEFVALSARIEAEIAALSDEDAAAFREDLGLEEPALERLLQASLRALGLITFFTMNEDELRAWTVPEGSTALEAAGTVHTDMARGFIRAEVVDWASLAEAGSWSAARQAAQVRLEGKEHPIRDGEVVNVRFAV